jgi:teichuronic acid biosynthesis glycosyltransferase TuaG
MSPRSLCSVIVPAYNVEEFVGAAVASALVQTYRDTEVIVVNDGSTDATADALAPVRARILYMDQPNLGAYVARNRAIEASRGSYLAFLDADDLWLPGRLERMIAFLDHHPEYGLATSDSYLLYGDHRSHDTFYGNLPRRRRFRHLDQAYWIVQYNFMHAMTVVRRSILDRHGLFDERLRSGEDWEMWIRLLNSGERAGFVGEPLGFYRLRAGSLTAAWHDSLRSEAEVLEQARQRIGEVPGIEGRLRLTRGLTELAGGDLRSARRLLREASSDGSLPPGTRLRAAAAAALPSGARRAYLRWRERRTPSDARSSNSGRPPR